MTHIELTAKSVVPALRSEMNYIKRDFKSFMKKTELKDNNNKKHINLEA